MRIIILLPFIITVAGCTSHVTKDVWYDRLQTTYFCEVVKKDMPYVESCFSTQEMCFHLQEEYEGCLAYIYHNKMPEIVRQDDQVSAANDLVVCTFRRFHNGRETEFNDSLECQNIIDIAYK